MPEDTLETGLSSLGGHSPQAAREPVWKKAVRTLAVYVASLVTLLVLDIVWMKGIAPALGVDYFAVIQVRSAQRLLTICFTSFSGPVCFSASLASGPVLLAAFSVSMILSLEKLLFFSWDTPVFSPLCLQGAAGALGEARGIQ